MPKAVISVQEAREILGKDAEGMSNEEIEFVIENLDLMAKDVLNINRVEIHRKRDAMRMANLIYDIFQDKKVRDGKSKAT